jgi:hypothetical protein
VLGLATDHYPNPAYALNVAIFRYVLVTIFIYLLLANVHLRKLLPCSSFGVKKALPACAEGHLLHVSTDMAPSAHILG